ncbi:MAG: MerR family transcriptional regulator, partial [Anaerolineales bacterium]
MNTPECENTYLINELAELADISLRTLRYYDHIDLLKPSWRDENGYRNYSYRDLLTLQRILFFKEFDVPLTDLKRFLHDPEVNSLDLLREHALN